jgi:histidyl-tRNA synthetase
MFYNRTTMENIIQPKILKGFRDSLPQDEILRADLIEKLTKTFRGYGFVPIDTPVLEYTEILLRKSDGETEKQMFRFQDNGGRDVAMRFDLTVPFARFTAQHRDELYFPFKRYHIAKVWRGEKPQAGRFREFVQCDFDIVGSDSASGDFEVLSLMKKSLAEIGVKKATIHVNHRGIFNRFLKKIGLIEKSEEILRTVDKLAKIGEEKTLNELSETGGNDAAKKILDYIKPLENFEATLAHMEELAGGEDRDSLRMKEIFAMIKSCGEENSFVLDPSITRGLDYYTGVVYETFLDDLPSIGSVCSGGRYDNLAGLYMKEKLPGVGASIGLDRLIAALTELGLSEEKIGYLDAEIFNENEKFSVLYQKIAAELRKNGICTEVFPECAKISRQYAVAEKKNVPWGIFAKDGSGKISLKNLKTREIFADFSVEDAAKKIKGTE